MAAGDMRYGCCGMCGGSEVYWGEYVAEAGLRRAGGGPLGARKPVFDAYVCAVCGHVQMHLRLDAKMSAHIRNKLKWVPPQQNWG